MLRRLTEEVCRRVYWTCLSAATGMTVATLRRKGAVWWAVRFEKTRCARR